MELDRPYEEHDPSRADLMRIQRGAMHVEFYEESVFQAFESEKQQRQIFKSVDFIRLTHPGGKSAVERAVRDDDKFSYPKKWERYKAQKEQTGDGTPVEQWAALSKAQVMELKAMHIHTVEQVRDLSDGDVSKLGMGYQEYRKRADIYLKNLEGSVQSEKLLSELKAKEELIEKMQADIQSLKELVDAKNQKVKKNGLEVE